ncbi:Acriflavine sensitivity control protein acr-2 [Colletotrichum fructicola]|nr:Acriflavine sensitivity control protein acr-2 [Colletotrichum fructicola]KAF4920874.1 Acriflavine sensitivity control protein acr-2 [Colletotrichum fructicola]
MAPQKRPYRPKVKGCYECSKRRVSCDRRIPRCMKCSSRGLDCSGTDANVRVRFADGVNTRGKWAGETIESLCEKREDSKKTKATQNLSSEQYSGDFHLQAGCWSLQPTRGNASTSSDIGDVSEGVDAPSPAKVLKYTNTYVDPVFDTESRRSFDPYELHNSYEKEMSLNRRDHVSPPGPPLIGFVIGQDDQAFRGCLMDDIPSWKRELLLHFSEHIAGEMVAIDGSHNGWRYIVLPMAHADELVMNAVLAVSAFHRDGMNTDGIRYLETNTNGLRHSSQQQHISQEPPHSPQALYNLAIDGLRQRSNLAGCSYEANQAISVAVLVLLVAAMVTGREDYSTILSMLHSATNVLGGEHKLGATELGGFLVRQVRKNRVYAAPYISELAGIETLASESQWDQYFDCIRYCSQGQAGDSSIVATVARVMQQAHDIYLQGNTSRGRTF